MRRIGGPALAVLVVACVVALTGCGGGGVDSGGLSAGEGTDARAAIASLQGSNITRQLLNITETLQSIPSACRVHLVSRDPSTFRVYVFWIPWLGSESYTWLDMTITKEGSKGTFRLGTEKPVLPGGRLLNDGRSIDPYSIDTNLLSRYGPQQARKNREVLRAHAGDTFAKPGASCQLLKNGSLRLLPNA